MYPDIHTYTHGNYAVRRVTANGAVLQLELRARETSLYPQGPVGWPCAPSEMMFVSSVCLGVLSPSLP